MKNSMCRLVIVVLAVLFFSQSVSTENNETFVDILQKYVKENNNTEELVDLHNAVTRFELPCETPNQDVGICIPIKQCSVLLKVLFKPSAKKFLIESKCGDSRDVTTNPRVCCGKLGHYLKKEEEISTPSSISYSVVAEAEAVFDDSESNPLPKVCGLQNPVMSTRIFGGTEAALGEFPWMVRLIHENRHGLRTYGCSGFLIAPKFVLTAAHCMVSESLKTRGNITSVQMGDHNSRKEIDCTRDNRTCAPPPVEIRVAHVIAHPDYNLVNHHNDIGLIHLKKSVIYTDYIKPICLLAKKDYIIYNYYVSGWGQTEDARTSNVKMKVELPRFDTAACKQKYAESNLEIIESQICAGGQKGKDSCVGDSGGPLMMTPNGTVWFASGLVSYGISCGQLGYPGIYTSIPHMLPWIKKEMKKYATMNLKQLA